MSLLFESLVLDSRFDSGSYWIVAGQFSASSVPLASVNKIIPDSIITGSLNGAVRWYTSNATGDALNPAHWSSTLIANLVGAVHGASMDVNKDGYLDLVVAHKFGSCPYNCTIQDGFLSWLENPKGVPGAEWKVHQIGKPYAPAHRVAVVDGNKIIGVPIAGILNPSFADATNDDRILNSPYPISMFHLDERLVWQETLITDGLNVCHEAKAYDGGVVMVGCNEGAFSLKGIPGQSRWDKIVEIESRLYNGTFFKGVSSLARGKHDPSLLAFIAPYHYGYVGVKKDGKIQIIGAFGSGGHHIETVILKGSQSDSIVTGFRDSDPGLSIFTLKEQTWSKKKIYEGPVSMFALGDFDGDGVASDIVTNNWGSKNSSDIVLHINK
jgi:hypothetical protein